MPSWEEHFAESQPAVSLAADLSVLDNWPSPAEVLRLVHSVVVAGAAGSVAAVVAAAAAGADASCEPPA